jgi:ABC-2 type transport system permease protein
MTEPRAAGTIYDLGYQRYSGTRLGRGYAIKSLLAFSIRTAFGVGRGERSKFVPVLVGAIVFLPAIVQVGVASATSQPSFINYANHLRFTAFLLALFSAAQAPELIVTDKQQGVLSLYLSRPLGGVDYAFAKLAALVAAMIVLTLGPQLFMFLGKVFLLTSPWDAFKGEYRKLLPILGGTLLTSYFVASIALALSSFAGRRAYASASVIAFFLLAPAAAELLRGLTSGDVRRYSVLANPIYMITGFADWLFDVEAKRRSVIGRADLPGSAYLWMMLFVCGACTALLFMRYRKNEA